jgi:Domain of unknown function (DUF1918)
MTFGRTAAIMDRRGKGTTPPGGGPAGRGTMKARVGDRLITEGSQGQRACVIIGLHHSDGSPPYVVRWLADAHITLMFPDPYTRLVRDQGNMERSQPQGQASGN